MRFSSLPFWGSHRDAALTGGGPQAIDGGGHLTNQNLIWEACVRIVGLTNPWQRGLHSPERSREWSWQRPPLPSSSGSQEEPPQLSLLAEATHICPVYLRWWISLPTLLSTYCYPQESSCLSVRSVLSTHMINAIKLSESPRAWRLNRSPRLWRRPISPAIL